MPAHRWTASSRTSSFWLTLALTCTVLVLCPSAARASTPTVGNASPQSVTGAAAQLTFTFSDSAGYQDLGVVDVLINNFLDGRQACYLAYSQPLNVLYLVNDPDTSLSGMVLNGSGSLSNSQCTVSGAGSSAVASGKTLTLTLNLTFNPPAFSGGRVVYAAGRDTAENNSGWQDRAVVFIPPSTATYPLSASVSPSAGSGPYQIFTTVYRDATSYTNLRTTQLLISSALDGKHACYLGYDRANNLLYLVADDGGTLLPAVVPGSNAANGSGTASNSQCTVSGLGSVASGAGADLTLLVKLAFTVPFIGSKFAYTGVQTVTGVNSGWQAMGFWQVASAPAVTSVYPANGATAVPLNSGIILRFSVPVDSTTLGGVDLQQGSTPVAFTVSLAADGVSAVLRPKQRFSAGASYTVTVNGVSAGGSAVAAFSSGFTAGSVPDTVAAQALFTSPSGTAVPINAAVQIQFNKPIDPTSLANWAIQDFVTLQKVPAVFQVSTDDTTVTLTPVNFLAVGRAYSSTPLAADIFGNGISGVNVSFTTGFSADTAGPTMTASFPAAGDVGISTNSKPMLRFDRALSAPTIGAGIQLVTGGQAVPAAISLAGDGQTVTVSPSALLNAGTVYAIAVTSALTGAGGSPVQNPGTVSFTTGSGPDLSGFAVVAANPPNKAVGVGTNAVVKVVFNRRANPLALGSIALYAAAYSSTSIAGASKLSTDGTTLTFTPAQPLLVNTLYSFAINALLDGAGNTLVYSTGFTTGSGADTTAPTVRYLAPPDTSTGVAVNAHVVAQFSQALDLTTVNAASVTLSQAGTPVAGAIGIGADNATLTFSPAAALIPLTQYTVHLSGMADVSGNPAPVVSAAFTTASSATPDSTKPTVVSVSPANNAANVPVNTAITITFSKPVSGVSVPSGIAVRYSSAAGTVATGAFALSGSVVTFTPDLPFPGSTVINVLVNGVQDFEGNASATSTTTFTTQATTDLTPPVVTSVTPPNGATGLLPNTVAVVTFSKPLNPATVTAGTIALLNGTQRLTTAGIQISADSRTVTLNGFSLPAPATINVVATSAISDLAGNHLADFRSQFSTAVVDTSSPSVVSQRPATGATGVPAATAITLVLNKRLDPASLMAGLHVSQNGLLAAGTTTVVGNGQAVQFVPTAPFAAGALVQVFLNSPVYNGQFTVQPAPSSTLNITGTSLGISTILPPNGVFDVQFDQALDPTTVQASTVYVRASASSTPVPATVTLRSANVIHLVPGAALAAGTSYGLYISTAVKGVRGQTFNGGGPFLFTTTGSADTGAFAIATFGPPANSTSIGSNALVRLDFNKPVNPVTVTSASVQLTAGGLPLAASFSYSLDSRTLFVTPQALLPDATAIHVNLTAVEAWTGASLTVSSQFTTDSSVDVTPPSLVATSIAPGATGVPVNSTITFTFSEPIEPGSISASSCHITTAGTFSFSPDLTQATFTPSAAWPVGTNLNITCGGVQDLEGNSLTSAFLSFTTAFLPDTTPPHVVAVSPAASLANVPLNAQIQVLFTEPVQVTSLGGITVSDGGPAISAATSLASNGRIATLSPSALLDPNATYTVSVTGVRDIAGNPMTGTISSTFSTGTSADLMTPTFVMNPPPGTTRVGTNAVIRLTFSERMNPLPLLADFGLNKLGLGSSRVPAIVALSTDGASATLIPMAALLPNTQYSVSIPAVADLAGNAVFPPSGGTFTTGSGPDATGPTVTGVTPPGGATGVPVNTVIRLLLSEPADPTTVGASTVQLLQGASPVAGAVTLSADGATIFFIPAARLATSSSYTVQVSGVTDRTANLISAFASTFVTSASSAADTVAPQVISVLPANGATAVPVNTQIVVTFSNLVGPASVTSATFPITADGVRLAGGYSVNGSQAVFTPASSLPGNATITVSVSAVTDVAGNSSGSFSSQFVTAPGTDTTPPTVTAVTPPNGATGIPTSTPVVITFSEPLNPATITTSNFGLFNGATALQFSLVRSDDSMTVTMSPTLPTNASVTVVVTHGVTDLSGNPLADFTSQFTTASYSAGNPASVTSLQPPAQSTNVAASTNISIVFDRPMDPTSVANGIFVSQNGVLTAGTLSMAAANSVLFTPAAPFAAAATVQVFVTSTVADTNGNPASPYSAMFTIAPSSSSQSFAVVRTTAVRALPPNGVLDVEFNQPVDPFNLAQRIGLFHGGAPVRGVVTLWNDRTIRFVPAYAMTPDPHTPYELRLSTQTFRFHVDNPPSVTPSVSAVKIERGAVWIEFTGAINPITANSRSLRLEDDSGAAIPFRIGFTPDDRAVVLFPSGAIGSGPVRVSVDGVEGLAGDRIRRSVEVLP